MSKVIRAFHDVRIQLDDGELSKRLHVRQGLKQVCVSFPLLYIFGAVLVDVIQVRSAADAAIASALVYLVYPLIRQDGNHTKATALKGLQHGVRNDERGLR